MGNRGTGRHPEGERPNTAVLKVRLGFVLIEEEREGFYGMIPNISPGEEHAREYNQAMQPPPNPAN